MNNSPPDVFNHNLESVPRLYKKVRPGSDYEWSLDLIKNFKAQHPSVPTKSGLMLGLGETIDEVKAVLRDLREHDCDMLTLGQYLQPAGFIWRLSVSSNRKSSTSWARMRTASALKTSPVHRWYVPPITLTFRRRAAKSARLFVNKQSRVD